MTKKIVLSILTASYILHASNVTKATDYSGDFLIAPLYIAKKDICSEIKVFNTNETNSILAKVAIREHLSSREVDLPIFLSPGDAWSGTVCQKNNKVFLTSIDDSNHPKIMNILKTGKDLTTQSKNAGYTNIDFTKGYIEVYPIAQFNENNNKKVNKNVLVSRWDTLAAGNLNYSNLKKDGVDGYSLSGILSFKYNNSITSTLPMTAFKGVHNKQVAGNDIAYSQDSNPEILLGQNEKTEILKLLQKDTVSLTYDNSGLNQFINLTFPFGYKANQSRKFKLIIRDMSENKHIAETVIFSPAPIKSSYTTKNEVATLSVNKLINLTSNPAKFKEGMIQLKDITNELDIQLGNNKIASFIATSVRVSQKDINSEMIINANYLPVK